jgi:hypothetical protein
MLGATDRAALTDLVHRYAAGVDDRQIDSVTALFTDTAELMLPEPPAALDPVHRHCGHAAIRTAIAAVAATIRTEHAIVGEVFDAGLQPDSARGRIACVAHHWSQYDRRGLASALRRRVSADRCRMADRPPRFDDQRHRDPPGAPVAVRGAIGVRRRSGFASPTGAVLNVPCRQGE